MLTWAGFIGKLIELIVNKVAGKKIDLALDEKKKAAKAFVRFHEVVIDLEGNLDDFIDYINIFIERNNTKIYTMHIEGRVINKLQKTSLEFIECLGDLGDVLKYYDNDLANLLGAISTMKMGLIFNLYSLFAQSINNQEFKYSEYVKPLILFKNQPEERFYSNIYFTEPNEELLNIDLIAFNKKYNSSTSRFTDHKEFISYYEAVFDEINKNVKHTHIKYDEIGKLIKLKPTIISQKELLSRTRESMRQFIQKQFTIADVLYVVK